jgi:hypothetical protein
VNFTLRNASRHDHGSAVVVVIVLLGLMLIFVFANLKTLHFIDRELKLIEKRQLQRLSATVPATNNSNQILTNSPPSTLPVPEPTQSPEK